MLPKFFFSINVDPFFSFLIFSFLSLESDDKEDVIETVTFGREAQQKNFACTDTKEI